jgi:membrane protease YdiL (CAAX protease family)
MSTTGMLQRPQITTVRPRGLVSEHPLLAFFAIAFVVTWVYELLCFGLLDLPGLPWMLLAPFVPAMAAVLVTRAIEGTPGVRTLWQRVTLWRVGMRWYALALVGIPILAVLSFVFLPDGTENLPGSAVLIPPTYLALILVMFFLGGGQEEPGWRGFALPRMQARFGPLPGTVLLGLLWGVWHLPLFLWVPDYNNAGFGFVSVTATFLGFVGYSVALSLIMTWVFNHTRGSVFMAMLVHATANANFALAPESQLAGTSVVLSIAVLALVILAATRGQLGYRELPLAPATSAADN